MADVKENDILTGIVTGIESYGIFVNIDDYSGLVHISEISENFVRNVNDFANIGDKIKVKVLEVDEKKHQLKLSVKSLVGPTKREKREKILETSTGFSTLQEHLKSWVDMKIDEINEK